MDGFMTIGTPWPSQLLLQRTGARDVAPCCFLGRTGPPGTRHSIFFCFLPHGPAIGSAQHALPTCLPDVKSAVST